MISLEDSIPKKNTAYKLGEDIFFYQFNDISFYIEDENQENFFFCILKKLFPDIKIEKIFPLGGKLNVIEESKNNTENKKKVFIVDKDFDDILEKIEIHQNLFYLERYSIENYLLEKDAIIEYIIGEKPRLSKSFIRRNFDFDDCLSNISCSIASLVHLHIVVQKNNLGISNISRNPDRFVAFISNSFSTRDSEIEKYKEEIQTELHGRDRRLTVNGQLRKVVGIIKLNTNEQCMKHIPGKYLLKLLKKLIESIFSLPSRNNESYCFHLAEQCNCNSLRALQTNIHRYIA